MTTNDTDSVKSNDSSLDVLRLFKIQPNHHFITKQDLSKIYSKLPISEVVDTSNCVINHYYTWNSPSTNAPFHKERSDIIMSLHSAKRASRSNSFTKSHRVRDIVSMCSDVAVAPWAPEEYSYLKDDTEPNVDTTQRHSRDTAEEIAIPEWMISPASNISSSLLTDAAQDHQQVHRCESCEAVDGQSDVSNDTELVVGLKHSDKKQAKWKRKFSKIFRRNKSNSTTVLGRP